jgi:hypothetical protein
VRGSIAVNPRTVEFDFPSLKMSKIATGVVTQQLTKGEVSTIRMGDTAALAQHVQIRRGIVVS